MADRDEDSMRGESLRSSIEHQIVEALDGSPQLRAERSRHLLLDVVIRLSGVALQVADYPTARQWFFGLVHACSAEPGGIEALLAAAVRLRPDPGAATRLTQLQDEWGALETAAQAPADLWSRLCGELSEITRAESVESFRAVTGDRQALPPPHCANAWHVFLHLAGRNADREGPPPHVVFLERVAHRLTPATGGRVDQWNRRRAHEWGLADMSGLPSGRRQRDDLLAAPPEADISGSLSRVEQRVLADVFHRPTAARQVLAAAGMVRGSQPVWSDIMSPAEFWGEVNHLLTAGVLPDGRRRVLAAAAKLYPANPVFTAGSA